MFRSVSPVCALVALALGSASCSTVGGPSVPGPPPEAVQGLFGGVVIVDGTEIEGLLGLSMTEDGFAAEFTSESFGFRASGDGAMDGLRLRIELDYDMDCRGELRLLGPYDPEQGTWTGELVASDCTGDARGTFRFLRRAR